MQTILLDIKKDVLNSIYDANEFDNTLKLVWCKNIITWHYYSSILK